MATKKNLNKNHAYIKVYRGGFSFLRNGGIYGQETYEIFKEKKTSNLHYRSEIHSRASTGELLNIEVDYQMSAKWLPISVEISKRLGSMEVIETFNPNFSENKLYYRYKSNEERRRVEINIPPLTHIASPSIATTFAFILCKKFEITGKNTYSIISSKNMWNFKNKPTNNIVTVERNSTSTETFRLEKATLTGEWYTVYDGIVTGEEEESETLSAKFFISRHNMIPYYIEQADQTQVHVKYLNDLAPDE
jgi:hypothetical protein